MQNAKDEKKNAAKNKPMTIEQLKKKEEKENPKIRKNTKKKVVFD